MASNFTQECVYRHSWLCRPTISLSIPFLHYKSHRKCCILCKVRSLSIPSLIFKSLGHVISTLHLPTIIVNNPNLMSIVFTFPR
jgi:hypothetical protein